MEESKKYFNLFTPRSHCPNCEKHISFFYLIPIIGYLLQNGKCKTCKNKISLLYLINEASHLVFGLLLFHFLGFSLVLIVSFILFSIFYVLFVLDLKHFYLPINLNILIGIIGLVSNSIFDLFIPALEYGIFKSSFMYSAFGLILGFFTLWAINYVYKIIRKKEGIGGGDFILFGGIGSIAGPLALAPILFFGSVCSLFFALINRKKYKEEIPLGAGLILGLLIYIFIKFFELSDNLLVI